MTNKLPETLRNATRGRTLYVLGESYARAKEWALRHGLRANEWSFVQAGTPRLKGIRSVAIVIVGDVRLEHIAEARYCNVLFNEFGIVC